MSRRKVAQYAATKIIDGEIDEVTMQVAAYLVESRRVREADLVARSIEDELSSSGLVVAEVTSATELTDALRQSIKKLLGAKNIALKETIDRDVLGGIKIEAPGKKMDATVRNMINKLENAKV